MFININNPALHVRNSLAVLLVGCLQDGAAARVEGRSALSLHLGGEGGLVRGLALDIIHLGAVLGIAWHLFDHTDMNVLGVAEAIPLYVLTHHRTPHG